MVNPRARNKTARLAHSGYLVRLPEQGRVPLKRIQTAIGACAIRRTAQNKKLTPPVQFNDKPVRLITGMNPLIT